ncbi:MAG: hypothetical protein KGD66_01155 [Candidatus Lokiarchaeota archaeon]|nr:hypothetical protein [Candidatus Lokiarchaeota archaeon]
MSFIFYKVLFRGIGETEESSLTFNNVNSDKYINMTHYITSIKNLSDLHENIINFKNIEEVIIMGASSPPFSFNYYIVILVSHKDEKKEGYLIGNTKKLGDLLIGSWPFSRNTLETQSDKILKRLDEIISNHVNIKKISLIYSLTT